VKHLQTYFEAGTDVWTARVYLLTEEDAAPRVAAGEVYLMTAEEIYA